MKRCIVLLSLLTTVLTTPNATSNADNETTNKEPIGSTTPRQPEALTAPGNKLFDTLTPGIGSSAAEPSYLERVSRLLGQVVAFRFYRLISTTENRNGTEKWQSLDRKRRSLEPNLEEKEKELTTLKQDLSYLLEKTDVIERELIQFLANRVEVPRTVLKNYEASKTFERTFMEKLKERNYTRLNSLIVDYTTRKKDLAARIRSEVQFKDFFDQPSIGLTDYQRLKHEELMLGETLAEHHPNTTEPDMAVNLINQWNQDIEVDKEQSLGKYEYDNLKDKLPLNLRLKVVETDELLKLLIYDLMATKELKDKHTKRYLEFIHEELESIAKLAKANETQAFEVVKTYKRLRGPNVGDQIKYEPEYREFFHTASAQLDEFTSFRRKVSTEVKEALSKWTKTKATPSHTGSTGHMTEKSTEMMTMMMTTTTAGLGTGSWERYNETLVELPKELRQRMMDTDAVERKILMHFILTIQPPLSLLVAYDSARRLERETLFYWIQRMNNTHDILAGYKKLRTGTVWKFLEQEQIFHSFFHNKTSQSRAQFEAIKADERTTLDSFLKSREVTSEGHDLQPTNNSAKSKEQKMVASFRSMLSIRKSLPRDLEDAIIDSDEAERHLLRQYQQSMEQEREAVRGYELARSTERDALKRLVATDQGPGRKVLLDHYRALRKGSAWEYITLDHEFREFFEEKNTPTSIRYKVLKEEESSSLAEDLNFDLANVFRAPNLVEETVKRQRSIPEEKRVKVKVIGEDSAGGRHHRSSSSSQRSWMVGLVGVCVEMAASAIILIVFRKRIVGGKKERISTESI